MVEKCDNKIKIVKHKCIVGALNWHHVLYFHFRIATTQVYICMARQQWKQQNNKKAATSCHFARYPLYVVCALLSNCRHNCVRCVYFENRHHYTVPARTHSHTHCHASAHTHSINAAHTFPSAATFKTTTMLLLLLLHIK